VSSLDRAIGALLGLAVGDAVGTTVEFRAPGSFAPITDMVGGGPFRLLAGEWTDDTSMALCLAESILDRGEMDHADQLRRYLLWKDEGYLASNGRCFDIGITTRSQLERFRRTGQAVDPSPDAEAAANGSLMRLAGVPIRWYDEADVASRMSAESSLTTHPAQRPVDCCRVLGAMVSALIAGDSFVEVVAPAFWKWGELHPQVAAVVAGSWSLKEPPEIRGTGYCVHALEAALWAVGGADSFSDAVLRAANLGDDADTTAAIAGQLAGARWGASAIPMAWRTKIVGGVRITSLAQNLFAAGGGDTPARWMADDLVHAWWVDPGRLLAGEYPGHATETRTREKLEVLADAGIRTFVDLTTEADRLAPYGAVMQSVARSRRLDLRRVSFPIPDLGVVSDDDYDLATSLIDEGLKRGGVYVHCWGGVGRTGTVIGCVLVDQGASYEDAIARMTHLRRDSRKAGRGAPEMEVQHDVVRRRANRST
jgi:ADP-ribosyl-[dinitrogen reductase] hydrolase